MCIVHNHNRKKKLCEVRFECAPDQDFILKWLLCNNSVNKHAALKMIPLDLPFTICQYPAFSELLLLYMEELRCAFQNRQMKVIPVRWGMRRKMQVQ